MLDMNSRARNCIGGTMFLGFLTVCVAQARRDDPPPPPPDNSAPQASVDVQARGPVHEAYAEPTESRPEPSPLVTKEPPAPVDEIPPDQKPANEDVAWIPGYWAYDEDRADFTWVSGFWRVPPPDRQWVPGSWQEVEGGWHWVPGYWAAPSQQQTEYLPAPPPSLETAPSTPEPGEASDYVPGCWVYQNVRYRWRPGFWLTHRPGWIWVPAHYIWTTIGYVFVEGYWDHPLLDRGLLFAPVAFHWETGRPEVVRYVPSFVVAPDFLLGALFVRPANCHYYFGDYFESSYVRRGFFPWVDYRLNRWAYDPNFAWYRREFAAEPRWENSLRSLYADRFAGSVPRPPRTFLEQTRVINKFTTERIENVTVNKTLNFTNIQSVRVLTPLTKATDIHITGLASLALAPGEKRAEVRQAISHDVRIATVTREEHEHFVQHAVAVRAVGQRRVEEEARLLREGAREGDAARVLKIEHGAPAPVNRALVPAKPPVKEAPDPRPVERTPPVERPAPRPIERTPPVEKPAPHPVIERRLAPEPRRVPPPPPVLPKHEDRPVPAHEPPKAPKPPPPHAAPPPKEEPRKK
jgi:hypothetical protein